TNFSNPLWVRHFFIVQKYYIERSHCASCVSPDSDELRSKFKRRCASPSFWLEAQSNTEFLVAVVCELL
ncbi:hypothetical protein, partial [Nostoc sp.]|uniref:hypothetical protein n=1 Tax=Nostoc sp. TaxID=1180 RepID=UPI002FF9393E